MTATHAQHSSGDGAQKTTTSTKHKYLTVVMSSINCTTHHLTQYKHGKKRPPFVNRENGLCFFHTYMYVRSRKHGEIWSHTRRQLNYGGPQRVKEADRAFRPPYENKFAPLTLANIHNWWLLSSTLRPLLLFLKTSLCSTEKIPKKYHPTPTSRL